MQIQGFTADLFLNNKYKYIINHLP